MATHPEDIRYDEGGTDGEEKRKVQSVRGSTYTVSIPKPWVDRLGIEAGQYLTMKLLSDGSILASPNPEEDPEPRSCVLDIEAPGSEDVLGAIREAYVAGYDRIEVHHDPGEDLAAVVREAEAGLTGVTALPADDGWVLECLLGAPALDPRRGLLRMFSTTHAMWSRAGEALEDDHDDETLQADLQDDLESLLSMGALVSRTCHEALREPGLPHGLDGPVQEPLDTTAAARSCEAIGRHALAFARTAETYGIGGTDAPDDVADAHQEALKALEGAVLAHDRDDAEQARASMAEAGATGSAVDRAGPEALDPEIQAEGTLLVEWSRQVRLAAGEVATSALSRSLGSGRGPEDPTGPGT